MARVINTIAATASSFLLFHCLGCAPGTVQQSATQQTATPAITQVQPQTITAGSQTTTLKVTGTNFPTQAAILWNGSPLTTTVVDANTLSSTVGGSSIATPATVQVQVQNTQTMQSSQAVPLIIAPANSGSSSPLTISLTQLPQGVVSAPYTGTLSVSGGTSPYTWSIASGQLPAGLNLTPSTGIISGTPTASGNYSFVVSVVDSSSSPQSATATMSLSVGTTPVTPAALTINTSSLPSGTISSPYSTALQASGGTAPYTWSFVSGNLPAGLNLNTSTGIISGTPTSTGTASFTVGVADSANPAQTKSATLSLVVAPPTLTITSSALPSGTQSSNYSTALQATGGTGSLTWSISSGSLPAGLGLAPSTGIISGKPTASGNFSFGVTVQDAGSPVQTKSVTVTLSVVAAGSPLAINSTTLPGGVPNQTYNATLNATGGTSPYNWSLTSGTLPSGLSLAASTGIISGKPTASSTTSLTFTVTDSSSPVQSKSVTLSLVIAAPAPPSLTISATLPAGTANTAYSSPMSASGGTPAYTWSITSGSLPAGLTLAATTGIISGTPSTSGTSNFTVTVSDNGSPVQTKSAATSIVIAAAAPPPGPGVTWYIRPDGGTRYSANQTLGQCDGQADVAYSGTGTNQHCAFNDVRYLWTDGSWSNDASVAFPAWGWIGNGGDTYLIRGGPWRVGQSGPNPGDYFGLAGDPYGAGAPPPPSGTATQHTRILGENYSSCSSQSSMTQMFGGYGVFQVLALNGAKYVDVQCIELTRHSQCVIFGVPAVPSTCQSGWPVDDYAKNGITTDASTHDILLQDMWIHGFTSRGIIGPIGGTVTATRVDIAYNGGAGWDFDDGTATPSVNGLLNATNLIVEWNGCNQAYPGTGAISCYSQSTGGYGDGIGTPAGTCISTNVTQSIFRYNTQDGYDWLHNDTGTCPSSVTNSASYGNNGSQFKWGAANNPMVFTNNLAVANCLRLSAPMTGQPSTYNANLADFCRASDAIAFDFRNGGTTLMANNTIVATLRPPLISTARPGTA